MNRLHRTVLTTSAALARPFRQAKLRRLAVQSRAPSSVLLYDRVADHHESQWTISRAEFQRHVDHCQRDYELIDLAEVQRRVRDNDSCSAAVSFTLDDGYQDHFDFALPLLLGRGIPCTYFVTIGNVRDPASFPNDVSAGKPLVAASPSRIREAANAGIEIGCHSLNHVDFSRVHDPRLVRHEICDAKRELEQLIGKRVRYFAFPYGMPKQLTQMAIEAVYEAGFAGFCSSYGGYNVPGRDAFHIRRFHADANFPRLLDSLSFDARKADCEADVRYFLPPARSFEQTVTGMTWTTSPPLNRPSSAANHSCS